MITEQFQIIDALSGIEVELTINQISKKIKKSYAFTNKYTHELITSGIILTKVIGSAILCKLNYKNEETIAALCFLSISKNAKKDNTNFREIIRKKSIDDTELVIYYEKKLYVITDKKYSSTKNILVKSSIEFKSELKKFDFSKLQIIHNSEIFWRLVAEIV